LPHATRQFAARIGAQDFTKSSLDNFFGCHAILFLCERRQAVKIRSTLLAILLTLALIAGTFCSFGLTAFAASPPSPTITTASLPDGKTGVSYSQTLSATGFTLSFGGSTAWSKIEGNLPPGLSLSSSGVISGTPTTGGTFNFTVKAARTLPAESASKALSLTIWPPPVITTTSLPDGLADTSYNQTLAATGLGPISWSTSDSLPAGLSLTPAGVLSGVPTIPGTFGFTVKAANGCLPDTTKTFSLGIRGIITDSLPNARTNTAYSQMLESGGSVSPTWSLESGNLPPGLTLGANNGMISGKPTDTGTFRFTMKASYGKSGSATKELFIVVDGSISDNLLTITTTSLPNGAVGTSYNQKLTAEGSKPRKWGLASGILPPGLTINTTTGAISGKPTATGTFRFTVIAYYDSLRGATKELSIVVGKGSSGSTITITTTSLPNGKNGTNYSKTLQASTSGISPAPVITWSKIDGSLPPGLAVSTGGVISGKPTVAGTFNFTVRAGYSSTVTAREFSITVTPANGDVTPPPAIDPNAALTTLTSVAGRPVTTAGTGLSSVSPETVSVSVSSGVAYVMLADIATSDERATKIIYPDPWFSTSPGAPIALTAGEQTHVYIKVAVDSTTRYYDVTVYRAATSSNPVAGGTGTGGSGSAGGTGTGGSGSAGGNGSAGGTGTGAGENGGAGEGGNTDSAGGNGVGGAGSTGVNENGFAGDDTGNGIVNGDPDVIVAEDGTVIDKDYILTPDEILFGNTEIPTDKAFVIAAPEGSLSWDDTVMSGHFDESAGGFVFTLLDGDKAGAGGSGKAGADPVIVYTDENGNHISLPVTITAPETPPTGTNGETKAGFAAAPKWVTNAVIAAVAVIIIFIIIMAIQRKRKNALDAE
jgi:hypothetical protein